jgi:nucleoside-diphosphate-sugar epimerase
MNIGNGEEVLIMDLANEIAEQLGFHEGRLIFDKTKPDGQPRRCLDTTQAKERIGFEAKTYWKDGLKETIEWFLR